MVNLKRKENIETAALANQSNIDLNWPEIWVLLPVLISPITPKQPLWVEHNWSEMVNTLNNVNQFEINLYRKGFKQ